MGEHGEDVLAVGAHAGTPLDLVRPEQFFVAASGIVGVVAGVAVTQRFGLVVFDEAFLAVFADGLQRPMTRVKTTTFHVHQRTVHQIRQQPQHGTALDRSTGTDHLRRLAGTPSNEHRQTGQKPLMRLVEQVIRPVDRGPQRLLTLHRPPPPPSQQVEPSIQRRRQLPQAHRGDPRRANSIANGTPSRRRHT